MFLRKIYLKIKRHFFYKSFGFYPEDIKKLVYVQKYLDKFERKNENYNESIKKHFGECPHWFNKD